ncbi:MAG: DUF6155 family protein [Chloroflexota bacterium]
MSKQKPLTWTQIKKELSGASKQELLLLIRDLHKLNTDNKVFLSSRLKLGDPQTLMEPYRKRIDTELSPGKDAPNLNLRNARKALNDFKKASDDPKAIADLMLYYVEQGTLCALTYGDMYEGFYNSMESVYSDAIDFVTGTGDDELIEELRPRFEKLVYDTVHMGWGYHDMLDELYYNYYPLDETEELL